MENEKPREAEQKKKSTAHHPCESQVWIKCRLITVVSMCTISAGHHAIIGKDIQCIYNTQIKKTPLTTYLKYKNTKRYYRACDRIS